VIVSYRCRELLRRCLESVQAHAVEGTTAWVALKLAASLAAFGASQAYGRLRRIAEA
jgi:hypothetical protein